MNDFIETICDFFRGVLFVFASFMALLFVLGAIALGIVGLVDLVSPNTAEERRNQQILDATPHKYAEVDGCTIYTWRDNGYWHYMTKCPTTVSTEGHHSKLVGKVSKGVSETIVTKTGE
jgi:hypothetical protein